MGEALAHRGPDDCGIWASSDAGLAFRRLSIIDVAGGNQPIVNEDSSAAIILNGEIYNYRDLRRSLMQLGHRFHTQGDVETALHLYEEHDVAFLRQLRGMFALAIWDEGKRRLVLARDRVGKKPLYYSLRNDGSLAFASEIKAMLQHPEIPRTPDWKAIDHFLTLQYVPTPLTAFEGINRLPPAHWLVWQAGRVHIGRYWDLKFTPKRTEPMAELREELLCKLREAVAIRLESEVPLGAFLSGGVDSSTIAALASQVLVKPLRTFSIGFESAKFDESRYARLVAQRFGTDHHELRLESTGPEVIEDLVWHYDQPFGDSSAVPSLHVARITRPHVTVVLNGDGSDESFAGYSRYRRALYLRQPSLVRLGLGTVAWASGHVWGRARRASQLLRNPRSAYFSTLVHLSSSGKLHLYSVDGPMPPAADPAPPLARLMRGHEGDLLDAMLDTDVNHYLPDDLLVKMDVATMAHSLEARSPFLDHELMEFAAVLPSQLKLNRHGGKVLLKAALRGLLPDAILDRPKMGFAIPLGEWLRTSLRELLLDTVTSQRALSRGLFRPGAVRDIVNSHLKGDDSNQYVLWDLLMLELWMQRFIDQAPVLSGSKGMALSR